MLRRPQIVLRPFHQTDTEFFTRLASDERVTRYVGDGQPWSQEFIHGRIRTALQQDPIKTVGASRWFLATEENTPVGIVVSTRKDDGIEIGYWVSPDHWGRGIAGVILDKALTTVPEIYGTRKLIARVDPANAASAKVLTRGGFQLEATREGLDYYTQA
ncbi:GNAT family N-acetyltransferase [Paeniglutamicibacter sp. Y32M11]|uniref:GNAT family N-acetyltransferase n=1 Tax=Paeniglutamicibacter sp. Y32M11 TaxID=2853258 RepID=UPI001C52835D|nr:GNAT family protein [Paeniglutamicibacter sp. Y32M11]QXQ11951.1 GNAT family N-acetyltransferase [Paeniglutamicibacter sp. Y32M11]